MQIFKLGCRLLPEITNDNAGVFREEGVGSLRDFHRRAALRMTLGKLHGMPVGIFNERDMIVAAGSVGLRLQRKLYPCGFQFRA